MSDQPETVNPPPLEANSEPLPSAEMTTSSSQPAPIPPSPSSSSIQPQPPTTTLTTSTSVPPPSPNSSNIVVPPKPKKRTAYFIFADKKRDECKAELQAAGGTEKKYGVGDVAKLIASKWSALTAEDKVEYETIASAEKEAYTQWLSKYGQFLPPTSSVLGKRGSSTSPLDLTIPITKIRKLVKLDPDCKSITKEALSLLTYATELFTKYGGESSFSISTIQNRRKLMPRDVLDATGTREMMRFLNEDIKQQVTKIEKDAKEEKERVEKDKAEQRVKKIGQIGGGIGEYFGN